MIEGALDEMRLQVVNFAFPAEMEMEEQEASGTLDAIHTAQDIAESPMKRRKIDLNELDNEEDFEQTALTQALRSNPSGLDGLPRGLHVKSEGYKEDKCWAFLVNRQSKKVTKKYKTTRTQKKGAGRELVYGRESDHVRSQLDKTREKEWSNWKKYTDGVWIDRSDYEKMKMDDPSLRVIPTRWVDVNKAEEGEADQFKSRLVARGDLEDASKLRTDSPTCSTTLLSLVLLLAETQICGQEISVQHSFRDPNWIEL